MAAAITIGVGERRLLTPIFTDGGQPADPGVPPTWTCSDVTKVRMEGTDLGSMVAPTCTARGLAAGVATVTVTAYSSGAQDTVTVTVNATLPDRVQIQVPEPPMGG